MAHPEYNGNFGEVWSLIDRLNSTFPMGDAAYKRARRRYKTEKLPLITKRMIDEGKTFGEADEGPQIFSLPQAEFFAQLRSISNDLTAQVALVDQFLDGWFKWGEPVPPHYATRVAIILKKLKRRDIEATFLEAYLRHFEHWAGLDLQERAEKLGVFKPAVPLYLSRLRSRIFNIEMTLEWAEMVNGELKIKATSKCRICGSGELAVPGEGDETRRITCVGCSQDLGMVGDALRLGEALAKEHLKESGR